MKTQKMVVKKSKNRSLPDSNAFLQVGFSPEQALALELKSNLLSEVVKQAKQFPQSRLQQILDESQPRISDLMRGKVSKFSLETLVQYAEALKMRPEIKVHRPVEQIAISAHA
jgi:predicted XRE-type DNA-binding protein